MSAKVRTTEQADLDVAAEQEWWQEHRPDAPSLFLDELDAAFELLEGQPLAGLGGVIAERPSARRLLLKRTSHHVYYEYEPSQDTVFIYSVWGAVKLQQPKIRKRRPQRPR